MEKLTAELKTDMSSQQAPTLNDVMTTVKLIEANGASYWTRESLLEQTFLPLADVDRQCGFNSQRQFGTMFTMFAGISPGRFQRER